MQLKEKIIFLLKNFSYQKNSHIRSLQERNINSFKKEGFLIYDDNLFNKKSIYSSINKVINKDYDILLEDIEIKNRKKYKKNIIKEEILLKDDNYFLFVFIDGVYYPIRKYYNDIDDVTLSNVFLQETNMIKDFYGKLSYKYEPFNAINTIFSKDGAFIHIQNDVYLKKPIEILYITTGMKRKLMINIRNLIIVGKGANVKIIEHHKCLKNNSSSLINIVNEIYALDNSKVSFYKIQDRLKDSFVIDNTFIEQKNNSVFSIYTFSFQGETILNNLKLNSYGENAYSYLYGISLLSKNQIIDQNVCVKHLFSNTYSYQLYKSILWEKSKGRFNGKIFINKFLKGINAFQKNNNILLSDESDIYTKPQLEIYSENVKCSHGCTVGNIQESELFYLQSRGIPEKEAKILLLLSFLEEILKYIHILPLKRIINDSIEKKLNKLNVL
ncbi:Fe-S cluster assembly protein SufD [Blattabacterium cuenoti]|uniref:Fe-S cluster assembly protein SufD n=1 Tax=Blattabacterium cuenoti TaxID=1653831 RepID=UPI00163CE87F|nr:Fe-S cluster assembly protein SufD [Blattabacterium cuenoti]